MKSDVHPTVLLYKILQRQQNQTVLTISLSGTPSCHVPKKKKKRSHRCGISLDETTPLMSHPPLQLSQRFMLFLSQPHRAGKHPSCSPGAWADQTTPLIDTLNSAEGHSFKDGARSQNSSHPIKGKVNLVIFFKSTCLRAHHFQ